MNHVRAVRGIEVAALVHEVEGGTRLILRSRGNLSCSEVAEKLGGKGSRNAATFIMPGVQPQEAATQLMDALSTWAAPHVTAEGPPVAVRVSSRPAQKRRRATG